MSEQDREQDIQEEIVSSEKEKESDIVADMEQEQEVISYYHTTVPYIMGLKNII